MKVEAHKNYFWGEESTYFVRVYHGSTNPLEASKCVGMCNKSTFEKHIAALEEAGTPYLVERYSQRYGHYVNWKVFEGRAN